jgi:dTDP-4-dehydrorhamnose 3,5-epimerase
VLRGLHFQVKQPQTQIVYVSHGSIFDVVVDVRFGSPTFGEWFGIELSGEEPKQLFMAPGLAHGFCVLEGTANVHYKVTEFYRPDDEGGLKWSDPDVGVVWPVTDPHLSPRDAEYPLLKEIPKSRLPVFKVKN